MKPHPTLTSTLTILLIMPAAGLAQTTFTRITEGIVVTDSTSTVGCAWADYDNDGDLDLFTVNSRRRDPTFPVEAGNNQLYENNGDRTFTRITGSDVFNDGKNSWTAIWGDVDKDGDLDIYVTNDNDTQDFHINNGDGTFTQVTSGDFVNIQVTSFGASWVDYDNDGDLDLFIANARFTENFLYSNNGDGSFMEVTTGIIVNDASIGESYCGSWADYDNDGDLDLFVANRFGQLAGHNNFLYENEGNGVFTKITEGHIVNDGESSLGGSWGDYDNDGDLDLYVSNGYRFLGGLVTDGNLRNFLYTNNGDGAFTRVTEGVIVTAPTRPGSSSWGDYDNDGDLDLFLSQYAGIPEAGGRNILYWNDSNTFTLELVESGLSSAGCTAGDYDNDGDLDIFVTNVAIHIQGAPVIEPNALLQNDGNDNHWVNINCVGLATPTPEIGTKVRIKATIGGRSIWQMREITSQSGFLSQNSLRVHFGLGDATVIDSMKIQWLSGNVDIYTNVAANTFYRAVQASGLIPIVTSVSDQGSGIPQDFELHQNHPNPFNPSTTIRYGLSDQAKVNLTVYNVLGETVTTLVEDELKPAGEHSVIWNGRDETGGKVASGLYFYQMHIGAGDSRQPAVVITRKMVLVQ